MKILIVKPSSLGDVIHALPVLRLLKLHQPQSEISWWLASNLVPLLEGDPDLAQIFPFGRDAHASLRQWPGIFHTVRALRAQRFDWVIDLQGLARSGIFTWLAHADLRLGLDNDREGRREGAQMFYDRLAPRAPPGTHAVDRYLSVLTVLGVPVHHDFQWLPARPEVARRVVEKWKPEGWKWILLSPGARWNNKRWPVEYFAELIRMLSAGSAEIRFGLLGSHDDRELARIIVQAVPDRCLDLTGQTSLSEMVEWVRLSRLVITNDTGPMHVAAALGKPLIALFGPTNPDLTGPYGQREHVLQVEDLPCVPCLQSVCSYREPLACLRSLIPSKVAAASMALLDAGV